MAFPDILVPILIFGPFVYIVASVCWEDWKSRNDTE